MRLRSPERLLLLVARCTYAHRGRISRGQSRDALRSRIAGRNSRLTLSRCRINGIRFVRGKMKHKLHHLNLEPFSRYCTTGAFALDIFLLFLSLGQRLDAQFHFKQFICQFRGPNCYRSGNYWRKKDVTALIFILLLHSYFLLRSAPPRCMDEK